MTFAPASRIFLNPLLGDVHFALPDPFHFLGVLDHHLHAELHLVPSQVEVEERELGLFHDFGHLLRRPDVVEREPVHQLGLQR